MFALSLIACVEEGPRVEVLVQGEGGAREDDEGDCASLLADVVTSRAQAEIVWAPEANRPVPDDVAYEGNTVFYAEARRCGGDTELRVVDVEESETSARVTVAAGYATGGAHTDIVVNPFLLASLPGEWDLEFVYSGHIGLF